MITWMTLCNVDNVTTISEQAEDARLPLRRSLAVSIAYKLNKKHKDNSAW